MFKIGLTGGIASGKSTVSTMLTQVGIPVVDADIASRKVVEKGMPALDDIVKAFGPDVVLENGELDRKALGAIIFKDETKRQTLNDIVHPRVREWMKNQVDGYEEEGEPAIVLDIPLLIESSLKTWTDKVLLVYVTKPTQIERLMARDGISEEEALLKIHSQMSLDDKRAYADRIVTNEGQIEETRAQLFQILDDWNVSYTK